MVLITWRFSILCVALCFCGVQSHVRFQRASSVLEESINATAKIKETSTHADDPNNTTKESLESPASDFCSKSGKCGVCAGESECVARVSCPALVRPGAAAPLCHLPATGRQGVCCSTGQNHTTNDDLKARSSMKFDEKSLLDAKTKSKMRLAKLLEKEKEIIQNTKHRTVVARGEPTFGHFQSLRSVNMEETSKVGLTAFQNLFAMQILKDRQSITDEQVSLGLNHIILKDSPCPPPPSCGSIDSKYRTIDGTCNNIYHTSWGAINTATERLLPPNYGDGIWSQRMSVVDRNLPLKSARYASTHLLPDRDRPHSHATMLVMQFGQFLAHDFSSSVSLTFFNGSAISCCTEDGSPLPPDLLHFGCYPIEISDDEFYTNFKQSCMNFVRTQLAPSHDCSLGYAKQMNGVTHFLDLSHVYGSAPETIGPLREWFGGRLKMFHDHGRDLLPLSDDKNDCITMEQGSACFKSGDGHANQMISLVAVHLIFNREHNRVAGILSALNPHWSEQIVFLEARRILIAQLQHIVYSEWLPLVIGEQAMSEFGLKPMPPGVYSFDYNPHINPSLTNEFSVAAFRFGHSNVDGRLRIPSNKSLDEIIAIPEVMFHPSRMRLKEFFDRLLNGLTSQPMQETDPSISKMLTRYLFRGGNPFGIDLASLNIQRGRDHGLRAYNDYRQLVGLPKIQNMHEFGPKVAEHLSEVYADVNDIDLWIGGLLETPEGGALVGYTFREIIADQFSRFRRGDRYFYEHSPATNPGHFTPAQLAEIKKTSMSRLICDNSDHIELFSQSPNAFIRPDIYGNEPIDCRSSAIPFVDLTPWKEF